MCGWDLDTTSSTAQTLTADDIISTSWQHSILRQTLITHTDLEVVELESFVVVFVEVVSDAHARRHQNHQQGHAHSHPRLVPHMHLQNQSHS